MTPDQVPPGPVVVDTNVFSLLAWGRGRYRQWDALVGREHLLVLPWVVVGELRAGAYYAGWGENKMASLEKTIRKYVVLWVTPEVLDAYGRIWTRFHGRLKDGGVNDMWTAATILAQPEPPPLATDDRGDFELMASEFPLTIIHPDRP